jgi:hypothetical protein
MTADSTNCLRIDEPVGQQGHRLELEHKCSLSEVPASFTGKSSSEDSKAVRTERRLEEELTDDQHDHVGKSDP